MHENSTLIIQTSQADMCKNREFDTIYHEHINFFNVKSMYNLAKRANLSLVNVEKKPIHGSSYLFVIKFKPNQQKIKKILKKEKFLNFRYYKNWSHDCIKVVKKIRKKFKKLEGKKIIIGYGAAAKANTFLNFSKIKLDYIIDDNKLKQNKFCPGSKIPIKSIDFLQEIKDNIGILPLAWNFYKEIRNRVKKVRPKQNDFFILCFPKFKVFK